jgi:hypothetical protein
MSGEEMMKSAVARLQAMGMIHTTAMRSSACTVGGRRACVKQASPGRHGIDCGPACSAPVHRDASNGSMMWSDPQVARDTVR